MPILQALKLLRLLRVRHFLDELALAGSAAWVKVFALPDT